MSDERDFYKPTDAELSARRKRNAAIAIALAAFVIIVFFTMLGRSGAL